MTNWNFLDCYFSKWYNIKLKYNRVNLLQFITMFDYLFRVFLEYKYFYHLSLDMLLDDLWTISKLYKLNNQTLSKVIWLYFSRFYMNKLFAINHFYINFVIVDCYRWRYISKYLTLPSNMKIKTLENFGSGFYEFLSTIS